MPGQAYVHKTIRTGLFYVMTLRADAKKKDLIKFLEKEYQVIQVIVRI